MSLTSDDSSIHSTKREEFEPHEKNFDAKINQSTSLNRDFVAVGYHTKNSVTYNVFRLLVICSTLLFFGFIFTGWAIFGLYDSIVNHKKIEAMMYIRELLNFIIFALVISIIMDTCNIIKDYYNSRSGRMTKRDEYEEIVWIFKKLFIKSIYSHWFLETIIFHILEFYYLT